MWRERAFSGACGDWRGSVHDVLTGRRLYLTAPDDIADFVRRALSDVPEGDPPCP